MLLQAFLFLKFLKLNNADEKYIESLNEVNKELRSYLHGHFYEIFILDKNGKIVASSDERHIGQNKYDDDYFLNAKEETHLKDAYYSKTTEKNSLAVSTPIFNEVENLLGVFVVRIETKELNKITEDRTGLSSTGEIYLINKDSYMITPSRFLPEENTFLKTKVNRNNG